MIVLLILLGCFAENIPYVDIVEVNDVVNPRTKQLKIRQVIYWDIVHDGPDEVVAWDLLEQRNRWVRQPQKKNYHWWHNKNIFYYIKEDKYRRVRYNIFIRSSTYKDPERENSKIFPVGKRRGL